MSFVQLDTFPTSYPVNERWVRAKGLIEVDSLFLCSSDYKSTNAYNRMTFYFQRSEFLQNTVFSIYSIYDVACGCSSEMLLHLLVIACFNTNVVDCV